MIKSKSYLNGCVQFLSAHVLIWVDTETYEMKLQIFLWIFYNFNALQSFVQNFSLLFFTIVTINTIHLPIFSIACRKNGTIVMWLTEFYFRTLSAEECNECIICSDNQRDAIFLPCCHVTCCSNCALRVKKCLICRESVESWKKVWRHLIDP